MRHQKVFLFFIAAVIAISLPLTAQDKPASADSATQISATPAATPQTNLAAPSSFDQVIDRVVIRERAFNEQMRNLQPLVETYIQTLTPDHELGLVPASDNYFLGRLSLKNGVEDRSFLEAPKGQGFLSRFAKPFPRFISRGFAQMAVMDTSFDRSKYDFSFIRREFLGEVRCLVIDVQPKKETGTGRFIGRIWVEDQDYNVVRFNGTYGPIRRPAHYFHFDSWRLNMRPGVWLPAYIYSEESHIDMGLVHDLTFKAQTRLWGYNVRRRGEK